MSSLVWIVSKQTVAIIHQSLVPLEIITQEKWAIMNQTDKRFDTTKSRPGTF